MDHYDANNCPNGFGESIHQAVAGQRGDVVELALLADLQYASQDVYMEVWCPLDCDSTLTLTFNEHDDL